MPNLNGASLLLYGPPGVGKSSFASKLDDALFIDLEGGVGWLELDLPDVPVTSWEQFERVVKCLYEGKTSFMYSLSEESDQQVEINLPRQPKHIVIDTVTRLWTFCVDYVCQKNDVLSLRDLEYGEGYQQGRRLLLSAIGKIKALRRRGISLVLLGHYSTEEVRRKTKDGKEATTLRVVCDLSPSVRKAVNADIDIIGYAGFDDLDARVVYFRPTEEVEAKDRTGSLPGMMPLDPYELDRHPIRKRLVTDFYQKGGVEEEQVSKTKGRVKK